MDWLHWGARIGALLLLPACASAQNPTRTVPLAAADTALLRLEGEVVRADTALPVPDALVQLLREGKVWRVQRLKADGRFAFDSVPRGHIVLVTRAIGFLPRSDSLVLADAPALRLTIPLRVFPLQLQEITPFNRCCATLTPRRSVRTAWRPGAA